MRKVPRHGYKIVDLDQLPRGDGHAGADGLTPSDVAPSEVADAEVSDIVRRSSGGCNCKTSSGNGGGGLAPWVFVLLAVVTLGRRRRSHQPR